MGQWCVGPRGWESILPGQSTSCLPNHPRNAGVSSADWWVVERDIWLIIIVQHLTLIQYDWPLLLSGYCSELFLCGTHLIFLKLSDVGAIIISASINYSVYMLVADHPPAPRCCWSVGMMENHSFKGSPWWRLLWRVLRYSRLSPLICFGDWIFILSAKPGVPVCNCGVHLSSLYLGTLSAPTTPRVLPVRPPTSSNYGLWRLPQWGFFSDVLSFLLPALPGQHCLISKPECPHLSWWSVSPVTTSVNRIPGLIPRRLWSGWLPNIHGAVLSPPDSSKEVISFQGHHPPSSSALPLPVPCP